MTPPLRQALLAQYAAHKSWSAQLHHDNLVALAETRSELRPCRLTRRSGGSWPPTA